MHIDSTRLRELRTAKRWSQEQLAELSGLNLRTIQRLETGAKVSTESLRALAAVFEVPAETLLVSTAMPATGSQPALAAMREGVVRGLDFVGTTRRPDYWWFLLAVVMVLAAAQLLAESFGALIFRFRQLIVLLPLGAASARRLRDAGLSPWWTLIAFAPVAGILVLFYLHTFPTKAVYAPDEATAA